MNNWSLINGFDLTKVADAVAYLLKITIESIDDLYYCKYNCRSGCLAFFSPKFNQIQLIASWKRTGSVSLFENLGWKSILISSCQSLSRFDLELRKSPRNSAHQNPAGDNVNVRKRDFLRQNTVIFTWLKINVTSRQKSTEPLSGDLVREIFMFCENYVPYYPIPRLETIQRLHAKIMEEQFAKCPDDSGSFKSFGLP